MGSLGLPEMVVIGVLLMLIFGPAQLPKLGRSIGETIREMRNVGKELHGDDDKD